MNHPILIFILQFVFLLCQYKQFCFSETDKTPKRQNVQNQNAQKTKCQKDETSKRQNAQKTKCPKIQKKFLENVCNATWSPNLLRELQLEKCVEGGGGEGNSCKNNSFYCENKSGYCCPKKEFVCQSPADSGHENFQKQFLHNGRFAFDLQLNDCIKFSYFGEGGNFNNFLKYLDCKKFCKGE
uniref:BPTI/Kunitz inhibitor domain-containing protein n=1 Tax=Meloidogyne incognita TaxID=6306 RepID=A0A914KKZ5_MELIC